MPSDLIIAVDFDGTLAEHEFPRIGPEVPGAINWCREFQAAGARLILLTMRSDRAEGEYLSEAVRWCRDRGLDFWAVNDNPQQHSWTGSRKVYAHMYIDDAAVGCPLVKHSEQGRRPYVDWNELGQNVLDEIRRRA